MIIKKIESVKNSEINKIVQIHINTFTGFFLTFMGKGFLRNMYSSYITHKSSNIIIATDDSGEIVGFLAYSSDMSDLYKHMIKTRLILFAWYSLGAFIRKPKVFMRLIRAFLKPSESKRTEKYIELASIGVHPDFKSEGIGTKLIDELKKEIDFDRYAYITLETDAINNDAANSFYKKNGFELFREFETNEGRKMNEYRWCL